MCLGSFKNNVTEKLFTYKSYVIYMCVKVCVCVCICVALNNLTSNISRCVGVCVALITEHIYVCVWH